MSFNRAVLATGAAVLLLVTGCAPSKSPAPVPSVAAEGTTPAPAGWARTTSFPLEARDDPATVWTGTELLVFGGYVGPPCPPMADCDMEEWAADGAALDPVTAEWRVLRKMPIAPRGGVAPVLLDGRVYLHVFEDAGSTVLVYDVVADTWERLRDAPDLSGMRMVADGHRVLFIRETDEPGGHGGEREDWVFTPATGEWTTLPDDPFPPSFGRHAVSTPYGLVLSGVPLEELQSSAPGFDNLALLPTGATAWEPLPRSGSIHSEGWIWAGGRLVDPSPGGADGGEVDGFGRTMPNGGTVELPGGEWSEIPGWDAQASSGDGDGPYRVSGLRYTLVGGLLYDAEANAYTPLPRAAGAPTSPGPAAWAGDTLVIIGGTEWRDAMNGTRSRSAWTYTPPS